MERVKMSPSNYVVYRHLISHPDEYKRGNGGMLTKQDKFERNRVVLTRKLPDVPSYENTPGDEEHLFRMSLRSALEALKKRNLKHYEAVVNTTFYGATYREVGGGEGVSHQRIAARRKSGLEFLARFLSGKRNGAFQ